MPAFGFVFQYDRIPCGVYVSPEAAVSHLSGYGEIRRALPIGTETLEPSDAVQAVKAGFVLFATCKAGRLASVFRCPVTVGKEPE